MKLQMIVTDLDGTLLRKDKTISPRTAAILSSCRRQGIRLVYATARPRRQLDEILTFLPPDGLVCHNGALVEADGLRQTNAIPYEEAKRSMERLAQAFPGLHLSADIDGGLYRTFVPKEAGRETGTLITPSTLPRGEIYKLSFERRQVPNPEMLAPYLPKDTYAQPCEDALILVMHRRATKVQGAERLRDYFQVPIEAVVAFGDDLNDVEMLSLYHGVAMGNALPQVKKAARTVTATNEEDGLIRFLEEQGFHGGAAMKSTIIFDKSCIAAFTSQTDAVPHKHPMLQLFFSFAGELPVELPGGRLCAPCILVAADVEHAVYAEGQPHFTALIDGTSALGRLLRSRYLNARDSACFDSRELRQLQETFRETAGDIDEAGYALFLGRLLTLLHFPQGAQPPPYDERVRHIMELVQRQGGEELSVEEAARQVHLSVSRLSHLFKGETGMPLKSYLLWNRLKIAYAAFLEGTPITEACVDAGFDTSSHFAYTMKKLTGMSATSVGKDSRFLKVSLF